LAAAVGSRHRRAEGRSNVEQGASLPPLDSLFAVVGGDQRRSNAEHGACCCCWEVRRCASSKFQSQLAGLGSQRTLGSPPCSRLGSPVATGWCSARNWLKPGEKVLTPFSSWSHGRFGRSATGGYTIGRPSCR
jgi:hypothetical protein